MNDHRTTDSALTIGLDLSDRRTEGRIIDATGEIVEGFSVATTPKAIERRLSAYEPCRVVLEVGTHSPWMSRLIAKLGHEVIVANPRRVRLIAENDSKTDAVDAELLARLGRVDPTLLRPIVHRGEDAQRDLALLRARDGFVRTRTQLVNQARGLSKAFGVQMPRCSTAAFPRRVREMGTTAPFVGLDTLLETIEGLTKTIKELDDRIEELCRTRYPETLHLREIGGIGPITALCFVLVIEDPTRFAKSRTVGAYLGLVPRRRDSGEHRPQLRITKAGDKFLRRLLVGSAQYVMGPFGPDTDLRRRGLRMVERGGTTAKKRAVVATARRLAVLMHTLWVTGEQYEPLRGAEAEAA